MDLAIQIKFSRIYNRFQNRKHTPNDVASIIEIMRLYISSISYTEKELLLSIPICVLENQVELTSDICTPKNSEYIASNCVDEPFHSIFKSGKFTMTHIVSYLKKIISDEKCLNDNRYLGAIEFILCTGVKVKDDREFAASGKIYAHVMEKAFDC